MKTFKTFIAAFAILFSTTAFAGNESEDRALSSEEALRMEMYKRVLKMDIQNYNLEDCTVEVTYRVDSEGKVEVVSTAGPSWLAGEYVRLKMQELSINVAPELQNKNQTLTLRYVVI